MAAATTASDESTSGATKFHGFGDRIEHYALNSARIGVQAVANTIFKITNGLRSRGSIPDVTNPLLVDSALTLAEKIRNREVTSEEVVTAYLDRLEEINGILKCALDIRREAAVDDARKVDQLIASGAWGDDKEGLKVKMPFLGVPFTVKGPIELAGCDWSAGMHHFKHRKGEENGPAVAAMVDAGAIPIAVTNVPEFCVGWESYNKILGATRNPHDLRRSAGGSSGGEGCAIAACASPLGIGTDMAGSIRIPALFNGICGHKSSPGLVPVDRGFAPPLPPEVTKYLTAGPMARHAEDLLPMLKAMAKSSPLYGVLEEQVDLKSTKFFFMEATDDPLCSNVDKVMVKALQQAIDCLKSIGCDVQEVELKNSRLAYRMLGHVLTKAAIGEASSTSLKDFLNGGQSDASLGKEWAKFWCGKSKHTYSYLLFATCQELNAKRVNKAEGKVLETKYEEAFGHVRELLGDDGVLLVPTLPHTAVYHNQTHFLAGNLGHTGLVNILQLPATHVPVGFADNGLPVGVTIVANQNRDVLALTVASELQKALGGFVPGRFVKIP